MTSRSATLVRPVLGAALLVAIASPVMAANLFAVAQDMHTPNEVSFTSTAPLVKFTGRTAQVLGSANIDIRDLGRSSGEFAVNLASLDTGIKLRDEHMRNFLETSRYPEARFKVRTIRSKVKSLPENKPVSVFVDGDLTIHGVTRAVTLPAELTFLPQTDADFRAGDWVKLASTFDVKMTDFGIKVPSMILGPKVNNEVQIGIQTMARAGGASASMGNPCAPKHDPGASRMNPCAM